MKRIKSLTVKDIESRGGSCSVGTVFCMNSWQNYCNRYLDSMFQEPNNPLKKKLRESAGTK